MCSITKPSPTDILRLILLIVGIILSVDCIVLIAADRINFGTVVPFLIGMIFIAHAVFWHKLQLKLQQHNALRTIWKLLWAGFIIWFVTFLIFIFTLQKNMQQVDQNFEHVDAIIVLGGGLQDGIPTPTLANRLDTAAPLIKSQPDALVITSGGIGIGETRSEAEVMARYLYALYGVNLQHIQQEQRSTSTEENFLFSQQILTENGLSIKDPIVIVTSDFHVPRSVAIAKHQGYDNIIAISSPTPLSIRYNALFREYFAYISGWLLAEY